MLYSIENRGNLERINEFVSLKNQVRAVRLQDKLGKQNFHDVMEEVLEPKTDTVEKSSENLATTMMLNSEENNKALQKLNGKLLDMINDRGIMASSLLSSSYEMTNPENTSHFKLTNILIPIELTIC